MDHQRSQGRGGRTRSRSLAYLRPGGGSRTLGGRGVRGPLPDGDVYVYQFRVQRRFRKFFYNMELVKFLQNFNGMSENFRICKFDNYLPGNDFT